MGPVFDILNGVSYMFKGPMGCTDIFSGGVGRGFWILGLNTWNPGIPFVVTFYLRHLALQRLTG